MKSPPSSRLDLDTRLRLLEAAGPVFARRGFRDATVREICKDAGVNVAAINYHFGDKLELYSQTLGRCMREALQRYPPDLGVSAEASPQERMFAFVHSFLLRILGDGNPDWQGQLLAREMMEPTVALDRLVEELIRPLFKQLCAIVGELLGLRAQPALVILCARSVVSQCVFYHHSRPVLQRLSPKENMGSEQILRLAQHISAFSIAALTHVSETDQARRA
ncbi:MAG TPA: CerR family C-terminal domain-containing protein [Planctomycetota bacterium]|nr:CerR family C-terminal domain-containing protein [Planctomycetota bacterium]